MPSAPEQRLIGGILNECVPKRQNLGRHSALHDQPCRDERFERRFDLSSIALTDPCQQISWELAPDHGCGLYDVLRCRRQGIEASHQRALESRRYLCYSRGLPFGALDQRPAQLLDEQRYTVRSGRDLGDEAVIGVRADQALDEFRDQRFGQAAERKRHDMAIDA